MKHFSLLPLLIAFSGVSTLIPTHAWGKIDMVEPIYSSPVFVNGVLYLATKSKLYAIAEKK